MIYCFKKKKRRIFFRTLAVCCKTTSVPSEFNLRDYFFFEIVGVASYRKTCLEVGDVLAHRTIFLRS